MSKPNRRSRFHDMNLPEWMNSQIRRDAQEYNNPGTAASADGTVDPIAGFHGCKLRKNATQNVGLGNNTAMAWQIEVFDTDSLHNTGPFNTYLTVPEQLPGFWRVVFRPVVDNGGAAAAGDRIGYSIRKNAASGGGAGTLMYSCRDVYHNIVGDMRLHALVDIMQLAGGDIIEAFVEAEDQAVVLQSGGAAGTTLSFEYLGPVSNAITGTL